jgi:hypothetical protein
MSTCIFDDDILEILCIFDRFSMKHIKQAMERLKAMPEDSDRELTVLEKLLIRDPDTRTAVVMALDMMVAGIDTVTN